jgi:hypothetical protein
MSRRTHQNNAHTYLRRAVEQLEPRRLLCGLPHLEAVSDMAPQYMAPDGFQTRVDTGGIVWSNRGTSDNFGATYGAEAENVRQVVDAAFFFWNQVIGSLNQDGGNSQIDVAVTAPTRGNGQGGGGGVVTLLGNKPRTSSITLAGGSDVN